MQVSEFRQKFLDSLEEAARLAEAQVGFTVPRNFRILLHAPGYRGRDVSTSEAMKAVWLGEDRFFRIIDVSVAEVRDGTTVVFVRVSGHRPSRFGDTWNNPPGMGPFKQIGPRLPVTVPTSQ